MARGLVEAHAMGPHVGMGCGEVGGVQEQADTAAELVRLTVGWRRWLWPLGALAVSALVNFLREALADGFGDLESAPQNSGPTSRHKT